VNGVWLTVLLVGAMSVSAKSAGPVVLGGRELPASVRRVITLLAPTLLAALIGTQIFGHGRGLAIDARAIGLGVGIAALWLRVPTLGVVVLAAAATALARAVS
jgi:branched-subunit amino acid transport protein